MHLSIRTPRFHVRYYTVYCMTLCLAFIVVDLVIFKTVLFDIDVPIPDGAYSQYLHIRNLIEANVLWREVEENPILLMHCFRYAIYWPFILLQDGHTRLQYSLLTVIAFPVINHYLSRPSHFIFLFPLLMAYFVSYRSVLAAISIGYIVIYLFHNRNFLYLFIGIMLSFLSTAVMVQVWALFFFFAVFREQRMLLRPMMISILILLSIFIYLILAEKFTGFQMGLPGYRATVENVDANILVSIMSRSTIFVSILQGSSRGYIYILFGVLVLLLIGKTFITRDPRIKDHKFILLTLVPGFAAEGLGVLSIAMVFLWAMLKIDLKRAAVNVH